jgi:hypothetical protein
MYRLFGDMLAKSELDWICASDTGEDTDAPILGILDELVDDSEPVGKHGKVNGGRWNDIQFYHPVNRRWLWLDYQTHSPQEVLMDLGYCIWVK